MSTDPLSRYEAVIGLEVHTHLCTESKLFSPAPVRYGEPANHSVHPIDLGLPGVLPVLNERVVELAIRLGLSIHAEIRQHSVFARKNYFYPDLPKGYQISQYEEPVVAKGWIEIEVPRGAGTKRIGITRAHLEEDAGKSIHDAVIAGDGTHIDLNRAGVPLLEIVSEPDLSSPEEAGAYLRALRSLLRYIEVSEADMEKGQFRCDANVSLRPIGAKQLGTRTELKNINSFRFVEAGIAAEIERQADLLDDGQEVIQATMAYDSASGRTRVLRIKENADDYRYFPDPDLIPLIISTEQIERVRSELPELPDEKRARFEKQYELSENDARSLTQSRAFADFFEACASESAARAAANWMLRDVQQALKERDVDLEILALEPSSLAALIRLVEEGRLTQASAREIFGELVDNGGDPEAMMRARGLEAVSDAGILEAAVDEIVAANPDAAEKFRGGDQKTLNFLMGQVMKRTRGKADPSRVREILAQRLGSDS